MLGLRFSVLLIPLFCALVFSHDIFVTPSNTTLSVNCTQSQCGAEDCPCFGLFTAFQRASNLTQNSNITMYLQPGNYSGPQNTNITVNVSATLIGVNGSSQTYISDQAETTIFTISRENSLSIVAVTFTNISTSSTTPSIVSAFFNASVTITDTILRENNGEQFHIGIGSNFEIINSLFEHNTGSTAMLDISSGSISIQNTTIQRNELYQILQGIEIEQIRLVNVSVLQNNVTLGFVWAKQSGMSANALIVDSIFAGNIVLEQTLFVRNSSMILRGTSFEDSFNNNHAALTTEETSVFAEDVSFLRNRGSSLVDIDITCYSPLDVIMSDILISFTNSGPRNATTSVRLDGCGFYLSNWEFYRCFWDLESSGRLLQAQSGASQSSLLFDNLTVTECGHSVGLESNLMEFTVENGLNVTISGATFSQCVVNPTKNTLYVDVYLGSAFSLRDTNFNNVTNALYLSGTGIIENCNFQGSIQQEQHNALFLTNSELIISNSVFEGHDVTSVAIENDSEVYFSECTFHHNIGQQEGGALVIDNSYASFSGCVFDGNIAFNDGGAIFMEHSEVQLFNCTFSNNTSTFQSGGALAVSSNSGVTINECLFYNNFAGYGGAIHVGDTSSIVVNASVIRGNDALQAGGGLFLQNKVQFSSLIFYTLITENRCIHGSGGGLSTHFLADPTIERCNFTMNSAVSGGGISITDGSSPVISHCSFTNNSASSSGGAVMIQGFANPIIQYSSVSYNTANSTGGGLVIKDISTPSIFSSVIEYNFSPNEGGAAVFTDKSNSQFVNCTIENNESGGSGGAFVFAITASGLFTNCSVSSNKALSSGGGISFQNECYPEFVGIFMTSNTASEGGALSIEDTAAPVCSECFFYNNTAHSHGGAILASDFATTNFTRCLFANNSSPSGRGGVIKMDDYSRVQFDGCSFLQNKADIGGAIYSSSMIGPILSDSYLADNYARFHGGAIIFAGRSLGIVDHCVISNNTANESGGGIHFQDESRPSLSNVVIEKNKVILGAEGFGQGGGFSVWDSSHPEIINCTIANNTGILGGGGYIHFLAQAHLENLVFNGNTAQDGGGLNIRGFLTTMTNITVYDNQAVFGAGIYVDSSLTHPKNILCDQCSFLFNNASTAGGGVYIRTVLDFTEISYNAFESDSTTAYTVNTTGLREFYSFQNPIISHNTALRGAGIFYSGGISLLNFGPVCLLEGNVAGEFGGGVYVNQISRDTTDLIWLTGANFTRNDALYAGTNIAWNVLTTNEPGHFCENCTYGEPLDTFQGYQTEDGWATAPSDLSFDSFTCPSSLHLSSSPFTVSTILRDYFGNNVTGTIDTYNNITITVANYGNCQLLTDYGYTQDVNASTAIAYFRNLTIEGKNQESCQLLFSAPLKRNVFIQPIACNISLYGCPDGQKVVVGDDFDTCENDPNANNTYSLSGNITIFLASVALVLLLLIVCIFGFAITKFVRKKYRRFKMMRMLIPDLERKPMVSLESILRDPKIPHIRWSEITIRDRIGMGANGIVSRGLWKPKEKSVLKKYSLEKDDTIDIAVKELLMEQVELLNPITLEEFLIEIKFLSNLNHKNVVQFLGISTPSNITKLYLVTELMHFGSLRDVLDRAPDLPWNQRLKLAKDAAKGMDYLHKRKLIHRDLKSQNLLVNNRWVCKVADFGISTVKEAKTRTMTCIGTPTYMAPEVLGKAKYSEKADVFSFGILLVEIYTGKIPYTGSTFAHLNQAQLMHKICSENARPVIAHFPEALRELVSDCWNLDAKLRPSFSEIVVRLRRMKHLRYELPGDDESPPHSAPSSSFTSGDSILTSNWVGSHLGNTSNLERVIENLRDRSRSRTMPSEELANLSADDDAASNYSIQ